MPIKINWLVKNHVIYSEASGTIIKEDVLHLSVCLNQMLQEAQGNKVHFLQDIRLVESPYTNYAGIKDLFGNFRAMGGWYVVLDNEKKNLIFTFVIGVLTQILGLKTHWPFDDYQTLRDYLLAVDLDLEMPTEIPDFSEINERTS